LRGYPPKPKRISSQLKRISSKSKEDILPDKRGYPHIKNKIKNKNKKVRGYPLIFFFWRGYPLGYVLSVPD